MIPTALDLCTKLGYPDAGFHESGSLAKVLLDDLEAFVINEPAKNDPDSLTTLYLLSPVKKFRYPYSWTPDGHEITELLSQLFSMIVQNRALRDQVIEREVPILAVDQATTPLGSITNSIVPCTQKSEQNPPLSGVGDLQSRNPGHVTSEGDTVHIAKEHAPIATIEHHDAEASIGLQDVMQNLVARSTSRDTSPITKLALKEPTRLADLLKAGLSEPFPATAPYDKSFGVHADAQADSSKDVAIKNEPNPREVRQAALRRNQAERQIQGPRWRSESPPLPSAGMVKKLRWPPQYMSPRPTPQPQEREAGDAKTYKRRNIGGLLPQSNRTLSSCPEIVSESPVTPPQGLRRSARASRAAKYTIPSPPKTPKKIKLIVKKSVNTAKPAATTLQPSIQESPPIKDVNVHFFLSNDCLGAVPVAINECNTASSFFNQALSAWNLLGGGDHAGTMAAVSVTIDGFHWPIVLPRGNATAFDRMIKTMALAKTGKMGNLEVKVKCIKA